MVTGALDNCLDLIFSLTKSVRSVMETPKKTQPSFSTIQTYPKSSFYPTYNILTASEPNMKKLEKETMCRGNPAHARRENLQE